jgi:hypothetical protein
MENYDRRSIPLFKEWCDELDTTDTDTDNLKILQYAVSCAENGLAHLKAETATIADEL